MSRIVINGPRELSGKFKIQGAKNSILPILCASILSRGECVINNCPDILDVHTTLEILNHLGCKTKFEDSTIVVNSECITTNEIPESLMRKMRSSIVFLGALIARTGRAKLSLPGGCELGPRPIDLHLSSLQQLGVSIENVHGMLDCKIIDKIEGKDIVLPFPSVGATENILLASSIGNGITTIENAAQEPEIVDLANFLNKMGAKIFDAGSRKITIKGVKKFHPTEHEIIPDRIVSITVLAGAASTGGHVILENISPNLISSTIPIFEESGCIINTKSNSVELIAPEKLHSVKEIMTMPFPGFPTDAQPIIMAMLLKSSGTSVFIEKIFENRFKHISELTRLGAKIKVNGNISVVDGVGNLYGTKIEAHDLRGAASLVIAGLSAIGKTEIGHPEFFLRGYDLKIFPEILNIVQ